MIEVFDIRARGWEMAIKGMRNPMSIYGGENNSWDKADSTFFEDRIIELGPNDLDLATRLIKAGPEHCKFLRMIHVQMDITGPLYWWKEMDTYKVATTVNSCSTMHKIQAKEFALEDFSCEHLIGRYGKDMIFANSPMGVLKHTVAELNYWRDIYLNGGLVDNGNGTSRVFKPKDKDVWWQMIQLLPSSYNQLRTWDASFQTILSILHQRHNHKLDEWRKFTDILLTELPYLSTFYEAMKGDNQA